MRIVCAMHGSTWLVVLLLALVKTALTRHIQEGLSPSFLFSFIFPAYPHLSERVFLFVWFFHISRILPEADYFSFEAED